jgi:P-type Ca2+ transporter type 2C
VRALLGGLPESDARVLTFVTLVVADLGLILTNRNISGPTLAALRVFNPALWLVVAGTLALLVAAVASPALRDLFRFGELHFDDIAVVVIASAIALLWLDVLRFAGAHLAPARGLMTTRTGGAARHTATP